MNKSYNIAFVIFGYTVIQIIAIVVSFFASLLTWGTILYRPNGTTPGDGFGFLIIMWIGAPILLIIAIISPVVAHVLFKQSLGRLKRIAFSFLTPILSAMIISAVITWLLESI